MTPSSGAAVRHPFPRGCRWDLPSAITRAEGYLLKFDGYRMLTRIDEGRVRLFTRNGHDWTGKLQPIADALAELGLDSAWLDGEIVVLNEAGIPNFSLLQNAIDNTRTANVEMFLFDVPFLPVGAPIGSSLVPVVIRGWPQ